MKNWLNLDQFTFYTQQVQMEIERFVETFTGIKQSSEVAAPSNLSQGYNEELPKFTCIKLRSRPDEHRTGGTARGKTAQRWTKGVAWLF